MWQILTAMSFEILVVLLGLTVVWTVEIVLRNRINQSRSNFLLVLLCGHGSLALIGGVSVAVRVSFRDALMTACILCLLISAISRALLDRRERTTNNHQSLVILIAAIIILLVGCVTALGSWINPCDDQGRYFFLATKLWTGGNIVDRFDNWRTTVTGGSLYLQAIGLQINKATGPVTFDLVSGLVLLFGAVIVIRQGWLKIALLGYGVFMAITNAAGISPVNSVPRFTLLTLILGVLLVTGRDTQEKPESVLVVLSIGAVIAACGAIRVQALLLFGVFFGFSKIWRWGYSRVAAIAGVALICIAPWWIGSYRDTGTFLFPIFQGNMNSNFSGLSIPIGVDFGFTNRLLGVGSLKFVAIAVVLILFQWNSVTDEEKRRALTSLSGALVTTLTFVKLAVANDQTAITRYLAPINLAAVLYCLILLFDKPEHLGDVRRIRSVRLAQNERYLINQAVVFITVISIGISSGNTGLLQIPNTMWRSITEAARTLPVSHVKRSTSNLSKLKETEWALSISKLLQAVPTRSNVLTSIDVSELAISRRLEIGILGIPGMTYPVPHNMKWMLNLSPNSDQYTIQFERGKLIPNVTYPVVEFGASQAGDMVGIRSTQFGYEVVLDHWFSPLVVSPRFRLASSNQYLTLHIDIDRQRGLVRISNSDSRSMTIGPPGGKFHSPDSPPILGSNSLGFSTTPIQEGSPQVLRISRDNVRKIQFMNELAEGLRNRGVDFLLIQSPSSSRCLYSDRIWINNALSPTAYQLHAPYFFAWNDFAGYAERTWPTKRVGDFYLVDLWGRGSL